MGHLISVLTSTPTPSWVDTSWISSVADALSEVFEVMSQPPVNIFIAVGLLGAVVYLIKTFIPQS